MFLMMVILLSANAKKRKVKEKSNLCWKIVLPGTIEATRSLPKYNFLLRTCSLSENYPLLWITCSYNGDMFKGRKSSSSDKSRWSTIVGNFQLKNMSQAENYQLIKNSIWPTIVNMITCSLFRGGCFSFQMMILALF